MMQFIWPWIFFLLPLPWLIRKFLPRASSAGDAALRVPFIQDFQFTGGASIQKSFRTWPLFLYSLAWIFLLLAAARPQWIGESVELPVSGRDLMMAIDLSGSMKTRDFQYKGRILDRLSATKIVATDFIEKRVGDRIGLILFGEQAYLQTPLTFDRTTVNILLNEAALGLAGQKTAIGDAIGLTIKRLKKIDNEDRVLILLTDGANNAGEIEPLKAAELAARLGMKIYTIGIGTESQSSSIFGMRFTQGRSELDEKTLKAIAKKTGGKYFRARNIKQLQKIYQLIDKLEPVERDTKSYRPTWSLFYWPLSLALSLSALLGLARWRGWA